MLNIIAKNHQVFDDYLRSHKIHGLYARYISKPSDLYGHEMATPIMVIGEQTNETLGMIDLAKMRGLTVVKEYQRYVRN